MPAPTDTAPVTIEVTDTMVYDVVARTGLSFGVVANVLFATRAHHQEMAETRAPAGLAPDLPEVAAAPSL